MATYYVDASVDPNPVWVAETAYSVNDIVVPVQDGGADNKYVFKCTNAGVSGASEPAWVITTPDTSETVEDTADDVTWLCCLPDSWDEALRGIQGAFDLAVAGDIVYCRGTQTLTAKIDVDTNSGTNAGGFIKFIGCNAAGAVDGTRYIITANGGAFNCIAHGNIDLIWYENIECKSTSAGAYDGWNLDVASTATGLVFINCRAQLCGRYGWRLDKCTYSFWFRCVAHNNGSHGISSGTSNKFMYCSFHDNTGSGMYPISSAVVIGCLIYDNDDGFTDIADCLLYNCAIDGNADDGVAALANTNLYPTAYVIGCRITNHVAGGSIGLNANTEIVITGYNYFEDNTGDNIQNATLHQFIPIVGGATTSNIEDQANTTEGYTNTGDTTEDFNLLSDASLRRTAITIPTS